MVAVTTEDIDIIGIAEDELGAAVQVLHVRRGRVRRAGTVSSWKRSRSSRPAELIGRILEQHYAGDARSTFPREVLVPELPEDQATYEEWLSGDVRGQGPR